MNKPAILHREREDSVLAGFLTLDSGLARILGGKIREIAWVFTAKTIGSEDSPKFSQNPSKD